MAKVSMYKQNPAEKKHKTKQKTQHKKSTHVLKYTPDISFAPQNKHPCTSTDRRPPNNEHIHKQKHTQTECAVYWPLFVTCNIFSWEQAKGFKLAALRLF